MTDSPILTQKPTVYILYGDDIHAIQSFIDRIIEKMGDPMMAEMNITRLDGRQATDEDLRTAVNTLPFLSERRLVIFTHPLVKLTSRSAQARFTQLLDQIPSTNALILIQEDEFFGKSWRTMKTDPGNPQRDHWLLQWAHEPLMVEGREIDRPVYIRVFALPGPAEMPGWIMNEAKAHGGIFTREAAAALAILVGNDTQQASQEIEKLLAFVNYDRAIELEDVQIAAAPGGEVNIFEMVDAMGMGDTQKALRLLHTLLEEQDAASLFGMIIRQFRLLLQVREALDEGLTPREIGIVLGIRSSYQVGRLIPQAQRFTHTDLIGIYHHLLEMDMQPKSGQGELTPILDAFVVNL